MPNSGPASTAANAIVTGTPQITRRGTTRRARPATLPHSSARPESYKITATASETSGWNAAPEQILRMDVGGQRAGGEARREQDNQCRDAPAGSPAPASPPPAPGSGPPRTGPGRCSSPALSPASPSMHHRNARPRRAPVVTCRVVRAGLATPKFGNRRSSRLRSLSSYPESHLAWRALASPKSSESGRPSPAEGARVLRPPDRPGSATSACQTGSHATPPAGSCVLGVGCAPSAPVIGSAPPSAASRSDLSGSPRTSPMMTTAMAAPITGPAMYTHQPV